MGLNSLLIQYFAVYHIKKNLQMYQLAFNSKITEMAIQVGPKQKLKI